MEHTPQLLATSKAMREQDNRGTQYPTYCVYERVRRWTNEYEDDVQKVRKDDPNRDDLCESCKDLDDSAKPMPEYCDDCDGDAFDYYKDENRPAQWDGGGMFLTEKACHEYIESNAHHLDHPYSYVHSAYRNPEMIHLMQQIVLLTGSELPQFYR